jgi:hypothetical protein
MPAVVTDATSLPVHSGAGFPRRHQKENSMNRQSAGARIKPDLIVVLACSVAAIVILVLIIGGSRSRVAAPMEKKPAPAKTVSAGVQPGMISPVEDQWGIRVSGIKLTGANLVMELSYEVTDPDKAALLDDGATPASVLDPATGTQIRIGAPPQRTGAVSQHSRARSAALMMRDAGSFPPAPNRVVAGKTYTVQLPNVPALVKTGSKVVVVIGDFRTDYITVE